MAKRKQSYRPVSQSIKRYNEKVDNQVRLVESHSTPVVAEEKSSSTRFRAEWIEVIRRRAGGLTERCRRLRLSWTKSAVLICILGLGKGGFSSCKLTFSCTSNTKRSKDGSVEESSSYNRHFGADVADESQSNAKAPLPQDSSTPPTASTPKTLATPTNK